MKIPLQVEKKMQVTRKMRRLYHKAQYHYLTSQPPTMRTAHKATMHEAACKSDVQYGNWWDEQIHQGKEGICPVWQGGQQTMLMVGRPCKAPRQDQPPFFLHGRVWGVQTPGHYSEPIGSLPGSISTDPQQSNVITSLKSAAGALARLSAYWRGRKTLGGLLPS